MAPVAVDVAAGPAMQEVRPMQANQDQHPFEIDSDLFQGRVVVRIRHYARPSDGQIEHDTEARFFESHPDMHLSLEVQGRFKDGDHPLDDISFGVAFDRPIRDHLPFITPLGLKLVRLIDPTIEDDLDTDDPYAMAPMCANMNRLVFTPLQDDQTLPPWQPDCEEDVTPLFALEADTEEQQQQHQQLKGDFHARRKFFFQTINRQQKLPDSMSFQGNFVNPYLQFQDGVNLKLPPSFSLNLLKHWEKAGRIPVYFCLRHRSEDKEYLAVRFQIIT